MFLETHKFFKGDSYSFTVETTEPDLTAFAVKCYLNIQSRSITTDPVAILTSGNGLTIVNEDNGADITVNISPTLSTTLANVTHYYAVKLESQTTVRTISNGIIAFKLFKEDYYVNKFRRFVKDLSSKNKGEFLNLIENEDTDMIMYLEDAVVDFNNSFFGTTFTMDDFPNETLLFIGALLKLLISNGVLNARCALTFQDAGGIIVSDMDRWGRYFQLFNQLYNYWKNGVLETKRSWNLDIGFGEIPSDMRWGGIDDYNILDENQWRL